LLEGAVDIVRKFADRSCDPEAAAGAPLGRRSDVGRARACTL